MARKRPAGSRQRKPPPKPREGLDRPYNGGTWTAPRFRQFVISALRKAKWPPKYQIINDAFVGRGPNPATGKPCKLHRCSECKGLFPQNKIQADHIDPVIPREGFTDWNTFITRLFCEKENFRAVCHDCHTKITLLEKYRCSEGELERILDTIAFAKLPVLRQRKILEEIDCPSEFLTTIPNRRKAYHHHLSHGNFDTLASSDDGGPVLGDSIDPD